MTTAAQIAAVVAGLDNLREQVEACPTVEALQDELDGVNAELDAARRQIAAALSIANDAETSADERLDLMRDTLGP